jgi:quinolinate synthase
MLKEELIENIKELKKQRNAIILAHYYQPDEIQDIADYLGDSLALSRKAAELNAEVVVFCGVQFMAESASILSPEKVVLLPDNSAGCPLADMLNVEELKRIKTEYPAAAVVSYVNSSAVIKAESDICCTSSNALEIVQSVRERQIIFVPDKNLGNYVAKRTDKQIITTDGFCPAHERVRIEDVKRAREVLVNAPILVHPECPPEVVRMADYVGSTEGILSYVRKSTADVFAIGTEQGILHSLKIENPDKEFHLLSSCLLCDDMKKNSLEKIAISLAGLKNRVEVPEDIRRKAYRSLQKMIAIG